MSQSGYSIISAEAEVRSKFIIALMTTPYGELRDRDAASRRGKRAESAQICLLSNMRKKIVGGLRRRPWSIVLKFDLPSPLLKLF